MQMSLYCLTVQRDNMSAAKYDLTIDQGSDFKITLNVKEDGVNKDLTGWSARGQLRQTLEADVAAELIFALSPYDTSGNIIAQLYRQDTENLTAGQYFYDIEIYTDFSNVTGYYDAQQIFRAYTAPQLADITTYVLQATVNAVTPPDERKHLFDMNGDGRISSADAFAIALRVNTQSEEFIAAYNAAYALNDPQNNYIDLTNPPPPPTFQTDIIDTLTTGSVYLGDNSTAVEFGTITKATRIIQGKVNVTRQVTR